MRYAARLAQGAADIARAQALRGLCFRGPGIIDRDRFDDRCLHVLIEDRADGALVACCRLMPLRGGSEIAKTSSASCGRRGQRLYANWMIASPRR